MNNIELDSPITLKRGQPIKNRLLKSAMSEQLGDRRHNPGEEFINLYGAWARGGIGLAITGNFMVDREQLGEPKNIVLDEKSDLVQFEKWAKSGTQNNTQLWVQLNHPGKQVPNFIHGQPVAPSALPLEGTLQKNFNIPRELKNKEIEDIIQQFSLSAALAKKTGFSGVQIHGAHGYLVNQFLSSRHNQRKDKWGGSLENRMRFVLEIYHAIRVAVGDDFPVGIKLNSADFMRGGFTEEESMIVVKTLGDAGIDLIEISGGSYEAPIMADGTGKKSSLQREAYFLEYAEKVRTRVDTPLVVTGGFRSSLAMRQALTSGATDFIGLARPMALDPNMPHKAIQDEGYQVKSRALTTGFKALDKMVLLNMSWYEVQLARIAKGKSPKLNLSEWYSTWVVFKHLGVFAFRKRRA